MKSNYKKHLHNYGTIAVIVANEAFDRMIREWLGVVTVVSL